MKQNINQRQTAIHRVRHRLMRELIIRQNRERKTDKSDNKQRGETDDAKAKEPREESNERRKRGDERDLTETSDMRNTVLDGVSE